MCKTRTLVLQVICVSFVVIQSVSSFSSVSDTRVRRQANGNNKRKECPKPNFLCKSGECLDGDKECDGKVDCQDASDESNACHRLKCPPYLFTCKYGACVDENLVCDGKPDCKDGSDEDTPDCRKTNETAACTENQFRCSSGQCIDQDFKCDGLAECNDHSDEIRETCWSVRCPGYTHKCAYGACVNGDALCNGKVECFDGSDEDTSICRGSATPPPVATPAPPTIVPPRGGCILPPHPENGQWTIYGGGTAQPGSPVSGGTILRITCKKRYKLDGETSSFCEQGRWSSQIGRCYKVCPSIESTSTMTVTCRYKGTESPNCTDPIDGTLASFKCAPFYEDFSLKRHPVHICQDGSWDQQRPQCTPVCGQKTVDPTKLIINGTKVVKGDYPWQVALYSVHDKQLICGGSLLSQRVVLTAAHCVTNDSGVVLPKKNYHVAVGKYFRVYDDSRDRNDADFSEIKEIFVAPQYKGSTQNYLGDIALLITVKIFTLSRRVQPVCLDTGHMYNTKDNEYGFVTGWGYTKENDKPSDVLKELKVPTVSQAECEQNIPEDFNVYLTFDKMCAGYLEKGTAVCKGDSGGALVFKHDGRYYATGIVSLSPNSPTAEGGCNSQQYGLYTKVSNYINDFILQKLASYKVDL